MLYIIFEIIILSQFFNQFFYEAFNFLQTLIRLFHKNQIINHIEDNPLKMVPESSFDQLLSINTIFIIIITMKGQLD